MPVLKRAKAKTAQRVIEVLDFFDEQHRQASVMDIARRYNRPQSSTSELLASLVDMGLLYKDAASRSYTLTPRAAILGSLSQPRLVRDGSLSMLIDDLRAQTGLSVALIGMVGPNAQVFSWKAGLQQRDLGMNYCLSGGAQEKLNATAAGWLLLSTLQAQRQAGLIRRLNAEAADTKKFNTAAMTTTIGDCARQGFAIGAAGFGLHAQLASILLPNDPDDRPMALGLFYHPADNADPLQLINTLRRATARWIAAPAEAHPIANAA
jgi:DNA-binding IclR family transcriptional regulator